MALIDTDDLAVGFDRHVVVDCINLSVEPGGLVVLMGTNGSGKSTILRTLAGLLEPVSGDCRVMGQWPGHRAADVDATADANLGLQRDCDATCFASKSGNFETGL